MTTPTDKVPPLQSYSGSYCLFQDPWWLDLTTGGDWHEVSVSNSEGVIARLPYRVLRRHGAHVITQPKLTPYAGPWIRPTTAKTSYQFSERLKLTTELLAQLPDYDLFSQNLWPEVPDWLPFYWTGYSQMTRYTNWLHDLSDTEVIWKGFLDNTRKQIRKATKRVEIVVTDDVDRMCRIHELTFRQQGRQPPREPAYLRRVVEGIMRSGHGWIGLAQDEQSNVHAGALLVYDQRSAHYLIGGSDARFRNSGAGSLLLWNAIQFAAKQSAIFDFEGSSVESISHFFRGFNPQSMPILHVWKTSRRAAFAVGLYNSMSAIVGRPPFRP